MATKRNTSPTPEEVEQFTKIIDAAITNSLVPMMVRIEQLEASLAGAREAYKELRSAIPIKREPAKAHRSPWSVALEQVQRAHGHVPGTWEDKDEVRAQMLANREAVTA